MEKSSPKTTQIVYEKMKPKGVKRFASNKEAMEHIRKTLEELHSNVLQSLERSNGR